MVIISFIPAQQMSSEGKSPWVISNAHYLTKLGTFARASTGSHPYERPALRPDGRKWGEGCGDGGTDQYVPDKFGKANFTEACNKHDTCYGTLGSKKKSCDKSLETDMKAACGELDGIHALYKSMCKGVGTLYRFVLDDMNLGQSAYDSAQEDAFWKMIYEKE